MSHRRDKPTNRWYLYVLGLLAVGVIALAVLEIGPPSSSARTATEVVNAQDGVVQSTVSGTGNVQPGTDVTVNFNTSGTLQNVDVKVGQYVKQGQLLATLDPNAAQLTLDQAQEALTAAEDTLTEVEDGESTTGTTSSTSGSSSGSSSATITDPSASSIASAQASVYSAEATLASAQTAFNNTKLYAPTSGTIASLSTLTPGQAVSAGSGSGTSSSSSASSSGSGTGTTSAGSLGGTTTSSSGSSSSSSSGFAEIINTKTMTMTVALSESDITSVKLNQPATVSMDALSNVQLAAKLTAISPVGTSSDGVVSYDATLTLNQSNPQVRPGMSASATIIVGQSQGVTVPNQAVTGNGSVGTVEVMRNGKTVSQPVIVGLRGASRTVVETGLTSGEPVVLTITLPSLSSTPASTTSGTGTLGGLSGLGGLTGLGGGGFRGLAGGGGGGFSRGGGG